MLTIVDDVYREGVVRVVYTRRPSVGCDTDVLPLEPLGDFGEEDPPYFLHAVQDVPPERDDTILFIMPHQVLQGRSVIHLTGRIREPKPVKGLLSVTDSHVLFGGIRRNTSGLISAVYSLVCTIMFSKT